MRSSSLFSILPEYICTPDGMEIDPHGNLVLSCPNFADDSMSGCVVKLDRTGKVTKWFDVPVHEETGVARNMGIAFDGEYNVYLCDNQGWSERPELLYKGRVLRLKVDDDGNILETRVVAYGMEHPNGIRIRNGYMYVTQSYLHPIHHESGKLVSGVYRFALDEENVRVTNTLEDKNLFATFVTQNPDCQYGADGIAFDRDGNLYVGNFGDASINRITFREDGSLLDNQVIAQDFSQLESTDGMVFDEKGNLYIADFNANAIAVMTPDGTLRRVAQSPDSDGLHGELNQPGEPIVWDGRVIASCFDLVTGPGKVNTGHSMPATLAQLELEP
ncbi:MAG TPA: SMP-30/gluconolactonase/LRE family protein [Candidatus Caccousia avicola]|uniref:SMP-30/gluconolactonase/LRE family protein n=1 Tax=Candidatus Caccousia avicola TaxID=2840721 RepID=A0A9D1AQS7_9FIRM|nr:SMP-30/gluconolactonase/LRE family protein [Candidatus Caccousia avicola]